MDILSELIDSLVTRFMSEMVTGCDQLNFAFAAQVICGEEVGLLSEAKGGKRLLGLFEFAEHAGWMDF